MKIMKVQAATGKNPATIKEALLKAEQTGVLELPQEFLCLQVQGAKVEIKHDD